MQNNTNRSLTTGDSCRVDYRAPGPGDMPPEIQRNKAGVGIQCEMEKQPITDRLPIESECDEHNRPKLTDYKASGKLTGRKALITGGDSGIGRSIALFFALEGADVAIAYHPIEQQDAEDAKDLILKRSENCKCELIPVDIQTEEACKKLIEKSVEALGGIDLLINNAAYQMACEHIEDLEAEQVEKTFRTNIFAPLYLVKHAVPHMKRGSSIIFSTSVVAFRGSGSMVDYAATKAAMVGTVRSLAQQLASKGIRVNGVAPGPVWTPLQPISRSKESMEEFVEKEPLVGRIGQPADMAPSYVFLACNESSQYTGQILHPNSGEIVA